MPILRGIFPALITPLDRSGHVDETELRRLVEYLIGLRVHGFFVCGGTGQGLLLTAAERKQVVTAVVDQCQGRLPVIVHVGALVTSVAAELAEHAAQTGATAVAAIPPIYYPTDLLALQAYYAAIASASGLPTWIYHIPHSTGVSFTPAMVRELLAIEQIKGIKYTSPDLFSMAQIVEIGQERGMTVLSGLDDLCLPALTMGAHGAIGTMYNLLAPAFVSLFDAFQKGDLASAQRHQRFANRVLHAFTTVPLLPALYDAMRYLGFHCGSMRRPVRSLTDAEQRLLLTELKAIDFFQWIDQYRCKRDTRA